MLPFTLYIDLFGVCQVKEGSSFDGKVLNESLVEVYKA